MVKHTTENNLWFQSVNTLRSLFHLITYSWIQNLFQKTQKVIQMIDQLQVYLHNCKCMMEVKIIAKFR